MARRAHTRIATVGHLRMNAPVAVFLARFASAVIGELFWSIGLFYSVFTPLLNVAVLRTPWGWGWRGTHRKCQRQPLRRPYCRKKVAASMDDTLQNYMKAGGNKSEVQKEQKELAGLKQERSALIAKGGLMTKRQREKLEAEKAAKDGEGQDEDDADAAEAEPAKQSSRRGISRMRVSELEAPTPRLLRLTITLTRRQTCGLQHLCDLLLCHFLFVVACACR